MLIDKAANGLFKVSDETVRAPAQAVVFSNAPLPTPPGDLSKTVLVFRATALFYLRLAECQEVSGKLY